MMEANLKCPKCDFVEKIEIPKDKCLVFHECKKCKYFMKADKTCCVICEYSDKKCKIH